VARHWDGDKLALSPKHWPGTRAQLGGVHRAAIEPNWRRVADGMVCDGSPLAAVA
jgi:hypothetical protein